MFPSADPSAVSGQQRKEKANILVQFAFGPTGGKLDKDYVVRQWLEAGEYDVDAVFPDPNGPRAIKPPPNPKVALENQKLQQDAQQHQDEMQLAVAKLKGELTLNNAKITKLQAEAELALAKADGVDKEQAIALINAQIGAAKADNEHLMKTIDMISKVRSTANTIEQGHHDRIMDVHDRLTAQRAQHEAISQENEPNANPA